MRKILAIALALVFILTLFNIPDGNASYPLGCPEKWNTSDIVSISDLQKLRPRGLVIGLTPQERFSVVGKWKIEASLDGVDWKSSSTLFKYDISGDLEAPNSSYQVPSIIKNTFDFLLFKDYYFRYFITIARENCPTHTLYSNAVRNNSLDSEYYDISTVSNFVDKNKSLFSNFKEIESFQKLVNVFETRINSINKGEDLSCIKQKGLDSISIQLILFSSGTSFGCKGDFPSFLNLNLARKGLSTDGSNTIVLTNFPFALRAFPVDPKKCGLKLDPENTFEFSEDGVMLNTIKEYGSNKGLLSDFTGNCEIGLFSKIGRTTLLKTLNVDAISIINNYKSSPQFKKLLNDIAVKNQEDLKAKQEAEAKAAAELKAKQEAEATAKAAAAKKTTITCTKGKLIKKVTAVKPKCPSGYRKR